MRKLGWDRKTATGEAACRVDVVVARRGSTVHVVVAGELDIASAPELSEAVARPASADLELVVIDLGGVTFIDSSGLYALLDAHDRWGERLRIVLGAAAARLVDLTGLRDRLPIVDADIPGDATMSD